MDIPESLSLRRYGASPGSHSHEHFQILLGLGGTLELEVDGRGMRVGNGDGCVIAPGARHDFESADGSICLVVDSHRPAWSEFAAGVATVPPTAGPLVQYLVAALKRDLALAARSGPALLLEAWGADIRTGCALVDKGAAQRRGRAIDWALLQHWAAREWHRNLTVADLAERVHLSPSQFSARCQQECGMGPMQWLRNLRLAHARTLRDQGLAVSEVARRTGYRSPSALTAALRRKDTPGQTPPHAPRELQRAE